MVQPASNIIDLVNALLLGALDEDTADFYVPFYDEQLDGIRDQLIFEAPLQHQTIYILGQVGTGKTTALNFLANEAMEAHYHIVRLYATDLFDMNDVDIADIMMVIANQLMQLHAPLENKFKSQLESLGKKYKGLETEEKSERSRS